MDIVETFLNFSSFQWYKEAGQDNSNEVSFISEVKKLIVFKSHTVRKGTGQLLQTIKTL